MIIGMCGVLGPLLRHIGPLVITVVITLIALQLLQVAVAMSGTCWPISIM